MNKLNIGYFGGGVWSNSVIQSLVGDKNINICFIVPRNDVKDEFLKSISYTYGIPYIKTGNINDNLFINKLKLYNCDLFISVGFSDIFKENIFNVPQKGTINCHPGKLPFYRGRCVLNWAIINDEKEFGITVHYIDKGIDTGDIILQRTYPIKDDDNYSTILKKAIVEYSNIYYDAIKLIQQNKVNKVSQDTIHPIGTYYPLRSDGDEFIDWNWSSRRIFNFIRAINKPESIGAKTKLKKDSSIVIINSSKEIKDTINYIGVNGSIVMKKKDILYVKTGDNILIVDDYVSQSKITIGDRFIY